MRWAKWYLLSKPFLWGIGKEKALEIRMEGGLNSYSQHKLANINFRQTLPSQIRNRETGNNLEPSVLILKGWALRTLPPAQKFIMHFKSIWIIPVPFFQYDILWGIGLWGLASFGVIIWPQAMTSSNWRAIWSNF